MSLWYSWAMEHPWISYPRVSRFISLECFSLVFSPWERRHQARLPKDNLVLFIVLLLWNLGSLRIETTQPQRTAWCCRNAPPLLVSSDLAGEVAGGWAFTSFSVPTSLAFSHISFVLSRPSVVSTGHEGCTGRPSRVVWDKRHASPLDRGLCGLPPGLRTEGDDAVAYPAGHAQHTPLHFGTLNSSLSILNSTPAALPVERECKPHAGFAPLCEERREI